MMKILSNPVSSSAVLPAEYPSKSHATRLLLARRKRAQHRFTFFLAAFVGLGIVFSVAE